MESSKQPISVDLSATSGPGAALRALVEMVRATGHEVYESDREILLSTDEEGDPKHDERMREIGEDALNGYFKLAASGHEFIPREHVQNRFGNTIAGNYPEAGPAFLRFANTYWTLKLILDECLANEEPRVMYGYLLAIERQIGPLFFPTPGPVKIPTSRRAKDQRRVLEAAAPEIDIEEFLSHNPILQRDRITASRGCMTSLVLVAGMVLGVLVLVAP